MKHELKLLNKIIETKDIETAVEEEVNLIFEGQTEAMWHYILEFKQDHDAIPSKDHLKNKFPEFQHLNTTEEPFSFLVQEARTINASGMVRQALRESIEKLQQGEDPVEVARLISAKSVDIMRDSGRFTDANIVDFGERTGILRERVENPDAEGVLGIPTGLTLIDENFGGWQPGDFVVVIGWTGAGKSYFTRLLAVEAWKRGYSPLVISLEMDKIQEQYRMDTLLNKGAIFNNSDLMHGRGVIPDDYENWANETFNDKHPMHIVTAEGVDAADQFFVQGKIQQYRPDMVILDYHQLFDDGRKGGTEVERVKNLSKDFKKIAVRNQVPVLDVSGVTMADGHGERPPELQEIAWSKQLSYDSDLVLAVHHPADTQTFEVISRKVRRGNQFAFYLNWDFDSGQWTESLDAME